MQPLFFVLRLTPSSFYDCLLHFELCAHASPCNAPRCPLAMRGGCVCVCVAHQLLLQDAWVTPQTLVSGAQEQQ